MSNLDKVELINIKESNISEKDLDYCAEKLGSYDALFSKKAVKYRELGLNKTELSQEEIKHYILNEYTFLKRPVSIINEKVFAGNTNDAVFGLGEELKTLG
jgi:arsenate reductase